MQGGLRKIRQVGYRHNNTFYNTLFAVGFFFVYNFNYPILFPNSIQDDFKNMAVFPTGDGKYKLWLITDGSFRYTSKKQQAVIQVRDGRDILQDFSYVYRIL